MTWVGNDPSDNRDCISFHFDDVSRPVLMFSMDNMEISYTLNGTLKAGFVVRDFNLAIDILQESYTLSEYKLFPHPNTELGV